MAKTMEKLLGEYVIRHNGEKVPINSLCGKDRVLGIYFSAEWCPPCKGFTPKLIDFYNKIKSNGKFEIVFVSWDKDEGSYQEYFSTMPWLALPFGEEKKGKLCKRFGVHGIPKLVLIDGENGKTITREGYACLVEDENGLEFPWRRKKFLEIIKGKLLKNNKEVDAIEELRGKIVGIYFSAHWCPPCRVFTPELIHTYEKLKSEGKKFEIVFATSDRSQESFDNYVSSMPWLAVPFSDTVRLQLLKSSFEVDGIPMLVMVDENSSIITLDGRLAMNEDRDGQTLENGIWTVPSNDIITKCGNEHVTDGRTGKDFPWYPKPINELTEGAAIQLNESACLVLFVEPDDDEVDRARDILLSSAQEEHDKGEHQDLYFFIGADDDICDPVREFAGLSDKTPLLAILDFPEQKVYISDVTDITSDIVKTFVKGYLEETLQSRPCRR